MILFGTIVNALINCYRGNYWRFLHNIPERMKETVMYGIGLAVTVIGIQMTFESTQILIVIISIVVGAVIGEWMDLDAKVNQLRTMDRK